MWCEPLKPTPPEQLADSACFKLAKDSTGARWLARFVSRKPNEKDRKTGTDADAAEQIWKA